MLHHAGRQSKIAHQRHQVLQLAPHWTDLSSPEKFHQQDLLDWSIRRGFHGGADAGLDSASSTMMRCHQLHTRLGTQLDDMLGGIHRPRGSLKFTTPNTLFAGSGSGRQIFGKNQRAFPSRPADAPGSRCRHWV